MAFTPEEFSKRSSFVIKLGRALHDWGASSERTEEHLTNVTGLGFDTLLSPNPLDGIAAAVTSLHLFASVHWSSPKA